MFIQYWSMRVMAYLAALVTAFSLWGIWLLRRHKLERAKWFLRIAPWVVVAPFLMNTAGWMLTESGRQPWIVQGLMKTANAASPSVTSTDIWISLVVFVLLYIALGAADGYLMIHYGRKHLAPDPDDGDGDRDHRRRPSRRRRSDVGRTPIRSRARTTVFPPSSTRSDTMHLSNLWYLIVALFWVGFFILEGFDFGVGMLHSFVGRTDLERRIAVNSIGPFWDGNEVWLIVGGAAIFAAFPGWYATMFSTFYLALVVVLAGPDRPRGVLRVPAQDRGSPLAGRRGGGH